MSADSPLFVDTNVLLYCYDGRDPSKQRGCQLWLDLLWQKGNGRLSWQVLNQFYVNATTKIGAPTATVRAAAETYGSVQVVRWTRRNGLSARRIR
jgi:predicted nucleic acid-binding protein